MNSVSVCFSPELYPYYAADSSIVVIVDVFRASTSICAAFGNGAKSVKTVADIEEAKRYKLSGYLVAAERNTQKCDFADFGNSPFDFTREKVDGKELIFTTTNGTHAVQTASGADEILIGAFSNITVLTDYLIGREKNILILCSGWNNRFCLEDTLFSGALAEKLLARNFSSRCDSAKAAVELWQLAKADLFQYICQLEHYERLKQHGLEGSVEYCLTADTVAVVPAWNKELKAFIC